MNDIIRKAISEILISQKELLRIPLKQRAKFEGWLKFELAYKLQQMGMKSVEVESKLYYKRERNDLTFFYNDQHYAIELKTPNTNWKISGINSKGRPITKNVNSIVDDTKKLNSSSGIVAFVLFPIPVNDKRWEKYIQRISELIDIELKIERDCELIEMEIDNQNKCAVSVCSFMSKKYHNWSL